MKDERESRGRKARLANPGERVSLGLKVTADVKNKLDGEAKLNGRTQSQEAEARLDRSFHHQDLLSEVMELKYGSQLAGILMMIGAAMGRAGRVCEVYSQIGVNPRKHWADIPYAYDQAAQAAAGTLERLRPQGEIAEPSGLGPKVTDAGLIAVAGLFDELANSVPLVPDHNSYDAETARLRRALAGRVRQA